MKTALVKEMVLDETVIQFYDDYFVEEDKVSLILDEITRNAADALTAARDKTA